LAEQVLAGDKLATKKYMDFISAGGSEYAIDLLKKAGADTVITENFIAGMRMASEMVRPTVVSFLDKMLADKDKNLRVEEIEVSEKFHNKVISEIEMEQFKDTLILAISTGENWSYSPKGDHVLIKGCKVVVITTPGEREKLVDFFTN
jgi:voltage-gated potassium channel